MTPADTAADWVPGRGEVIWIDHNPFLVLSPVGLHARVGLVIGCAMTTAAHNRGSSLAVDLGPIPGRAGQHSFVLCHQLKSLDWRARGAKPHPMGAISARQLDAVMEIVGQLLGFLA